MQRIFEYILNEASKARFINKADLTDEEKAKYIKFFDEHPSFDSLINWQNPKEVTRDKLETIYNKYLSQSAEKKASKEKYKKAVNEGPKKLFLDRPDDFEIIDENDKFIFVRVLTYEGARFCDSPECGGQGAKWCIGYEKTDEYWTSYTDEIDPNDLEEPEEDDESSGALQYYDYYDNNMYNNIFVLAFNKDLKAPQNQQKYMLRIRLEDASGEAWRQDDKSQEVIEIQDWPTFFGIKHNITDDGPAIGNCNNETVFSGFFISKELQIGDIIIQINDKLITEFPNKVTIPDGVTKISNSAFKKAKFHNGIELPSTIRRIGSYAFYGSNIREISLPEDLEIIGSNAFAYTPIEKITLNARINDAIFTALCNCEQLKEIVVTGKFYELEQGKIETLYHYIRHPVRITFADSSDYMIKDGAIIRKSDMSYLCNDFYLVKPDEKVTELNIPPFVKSLCPIYSNRIYMDNVYLPDNIEVIGDDAFRDSHIKTIKWPKNLKKIGARAFMHSDLEGMLEIPDTVEEIGKEAFTYCDIKLFVDTNKFNIDDICNRTVLYINGKKADFEYVDGILYNKFDNLIYYIEPNNKNLIIPNGIIGIKHLKIKTGYFNDSISDKAIPNFKNIETIILPDSFELKEEDFSGFTSLHSITLPSNITAIPQKCFYECRRLTSIDIPDTVTYIAPYAFAECAGLDNIVLPPHVTSIGNRAFYQTNLKQLTLPRSVSSIDTASFLLCYGLENYDGTVNITYNGTKEEFENNVFVFHEGDLGTWNKPSTYYLPCTNGHAEVSLVF